MLCGSFGAVEGKRFIESDASRDDAENHVCACTHRSQAAQRSRPERPAQSNTPAGGRTLLQNRPDDLDDNIFSLVRYPTRISLRLTRIIHKRATAVSAVLKTLAYCTYTADTAVAHSVFEL
jgi:hypothetical protein